jgi:hypothetical protein
MRERTETERNGRDRGGRGVLVVVTFPRRLKITRRGKVNGRRGQPRSDAEA